MDRPRRWVPCKKDEVAHEMPSEQREKIVTFKKIHAPWEWKLNLHFMQNDVVLNLFSYSFYAMCCIWHLLIVWDYLDVADNVSYLVGPFQCPYEEKKECQCHLPWHAMSVRRLPLVSASAWEMGHFSVYYPPHTCWCSPPMNDSYQQGALLELF
jgi:hypothetical protein